MAKISDIIGKDEFARICADHHDKEQKETDRVMGIIAVIWGVTCILFGLYLESLLFGYLLLFAFPIVCIVSLGVFDAVRCAPTLEDKLADKLAEISNANAAAHH